MEYLYSSPFNLNFFAHVHAPFKNLPIIKIMKGYHAKARHSLKIETVFDYLK